MITTERCRLTHGQMSSHADRCLLARTVVVSHGQISSHTRTDPVSHSFTQTDIFSDSNKFRLTLGQITAHTEIFFVSRQM